MVDITFSEGKLMLEVRGADKLWALKSSLEIPLQHIAGIWTDTEIAKGWCHGLRMPGTHIPGVITAGTFYQDGSESSGTSTIRKKWLFWILRTSATSS
jgi:hypothetical protein